VDPNPYWEYGSRQARIIPKKGKKEEISLKSFFLVWRLLLCWGLRRDTGI
jgi:hypothetical protein